jgi:hypothetical protein
VGLVPPRDPIERQRWSYSNKGLASLYFGVALASVLALMWFLGSGDLVGACVAFVLVAAGGGISLWLKVRHWQLDDDTAD